MDLEKFMQAMTKQAEEQLAERNLESLIKVQSAVYSSAMAYTNLIVAVGYAGIFAVWNFTRDQLPPDATIWVALLLVVSIAFYVAFEIYKMMMNAAGILAFKAVLDAQVSAGASHKSLAKAIADYKAKQDRQVIWLKLVWLPVLAITIGTAVAAGVILVIEFVGNLLA